MRSFVVNKGANTQAIIPELQTGRSLLHKLEGSLPRDAKTLFCYNSHIFDCRIM